MTKTGAPGPYNAPALEKGLDILELLADSQRGLTQNQIAARLERSPSELFRMVEVLERRGYLARSAADGSYLLSLKLFELAHRHPPVRRLLAVALPLMHELAQQTSQSNHLVVMHEHRILVLAQVDSPQAMGFSVRLGAHFPFRADRVSARVLAAFQAPARSAELIDEMLHNDPQAPTRASLVRRVRVIREQGYEEHVSETLPGITDLCFPIVDRSGQAVATLTQPYLRQRDVTMTVAQARAAHARTALAISRELGATATGSTNESVPPTAPRAPRRRA
ncbi:MAG TPA: IclR family transcriptional regulator [Rubrivivax sp.]